MNSRLQPLPPPASWACSKPPLLRFLDRCHADFSQETGGAVADYIPELGKADPAHFGISLATLDGHVYEVGDSQVPFTIQSMSKAFVFALALDTLGAARVESAIGVEPSGDPFNSIRLNADNHPFNAMVNAGAIACSGLIHEAKGDGAFEYIRAGARPVCRARRSASTRPSLPPKAPPATATAPLPICCAPMPSSTGQVDAVLEVYFRQCADPRHRARHRRDGGDARQPRRQSRHRRAGHDALRDLAHAVGDDLFGHVRLRRRMDLPRRHPRQERRRRRHPGGAAGAARARQLFAETRQPRQQRARHQGLRGAVVALRPAHAQPQRRRPHQHHRRLRHRQKSRRGAAAARTNATSSPRITRMSASSSWSARCRSPTSTTSRASSPQDRARNS